MCSLFTHPSWFSYNDYTGPAEPQPFMINKTLSDEVVWEYENHTNEAFEDHWTESWANSEKIVASFQRKGLPLIPLSQDIPFYVTVYF